MNIQHRKDHEVTLQFVNLRGETVKTVPTGKAAAKSRGLSATSYHKGWHVVGFSPDHLAFAKRTHSGDKPFDEATFMRTSTPKRVRPKAYEVFSAAEQCADLARRAGWKGVHTVAAQKGQA